MTPRETGFLRFRSARTNSQLLEAGIHDSVTMFRMYNKSENERSNRHVTAIKKRTVKYFYLCNICNASSCPWRKECTVAMQWLASRLHSGGHAWKTGGLQLELVSMQAQVEWCVLTHPRSLREDVLYFCLSNSNRQL
jgi:hypothetical protein